MGSTDRDRLIALFQATKGNHWERNEGWNTSDDLSTWYGVTVNHRGRVERLYLRENNLRGIIPTQLGELGSLLSLNLGYNHLSGPIPRTLGALSELERLDLSNNLLRGDIPKELGNPGKLKRLILSNNGLTGCIPPGLGNLVALNTLKLKGNELTGPIPPELGNLKSVEALSLSDNKLDGPIPAELGSLHTLDTLLVSENKLTGIIPTELGKLTRMSHLDISDNNLYGPVPKELAYIPKLLLFLSGNLVSGGPTLGETVEAWRVRTRQQHEAERQKEEDPVELGDSESDSKGGVVTARQVAERESSELYEGGESEQSFRASVASLGGLHKLTRENRGTMEEVKLLVEDHNGVGHGVSKESLRELDKLVNMAKVLEEVASSKMVDMDARREELALTPDSRQGAYCITIRTGLCNAYLAASVIGSKMVSTSKTGVMGAAGRTVNLLAAAAPMIVGLSAIGAALAVADRHIQTKKLAKIAGMATDVVECCALAREVALRLAGALTNASPATSPAESDAHADGIPESRMDFGCEQVDTDDEATIDWLTEEAASYESGDGSDARSDDSEIKAGKAIGKAHLKMLLDAVVNGCVYGATSTTSKVCRLLRVILPEIDVEPVSTPSAAEKTCVRVKPSVVPVSAPPLDGGAKLMAELAAVRATVRRLELVPVSAPPLDGGAELMAELAAVRATVRRLELANAQSIADNKKLHKEMSEWKRHTTRGFGQGDDHIGAGIVVGGKLLAQARKARTKEDFLQEIEQKTSSEVGITLTADEREAKLRYLASRVDEVDDRIDTMEAGIGTMMRKRERRFLGIFWRKR